MSSACFLFLLIRYLDIQAVFCAKILDRGQVTDDTLAH